jgi:cell wall-associated NlpC family hydrolase
MLNQLSLISILILLTLGFQPQINVPHVAVEAPIIREADINRAEIVEFAKTYLGTTYRYASVDPAKGFDCSGFVSFVYNHFNISLPRASRAYKSLGTAQKPEDFKVGDILVFYGYRDTKQIGHVGIICEANGLKSKFIHSSSGKAYGVTISQLDSDHYTRRFYKCIDVIRQ